MVVLHVSAHPDDEAVGCPVTLLQLRDAGQRVINVVTSLGAPADRDRRRAEVQDAADVAGFELMVADSLLDLSLAAYAERLAGLLAEQVGTEEPDGHQLLVVSVSPHDVHPRHEAVGRAVAAVLPRHPEMTWWAYGIWGELPLPTLYVPVSEDWMARGLAVLDAYAGELTRNDYRRLVLGRGAAQAVLGSEKVFGFGDGAVSTEPYAELFTEVVYRSGRYLAGRPTVFSPGVPVSVADPGVDVTEWVRRPSDRDIVGQPGRSAELLTVLERLKGSPDRPPRGL